MRSFLSRFSPTFFALFFVLFVGFRGGATSTAQDARYDYGFDGPEIYKLDPGIDLLEIVDVNGDGSNDVVVVNNRKASLEFLLQGVPDAEEYRVGNEEDVNRLANAGRLGRHSVSTEMRVTDLVSGDLDGDGRIDLAWYGEPREVVVLYGGSDSWDRINRIRNGEGLLHPDCLAVADWTGDGRNDLVLLGDKVLFLYEQDGRGTLTGPRRIPLALSALGFEPADYDQDGVQDLLLASEKVEPNLRIRYGRGSGSGFGPEVAFDLPMPRSLAAAPWISNGRLGLLVVQPKSGRLQLLRLGEGGETPLPFGNPTFYAGSADSWAKPVAFLVADLNGDGLPEIATARPTESAVAIYPGTSSGPGAAEISPSYAGITHMAAWDGDGDGRPELYALSPEEKRLGRTEIDARGKAAIPQSIPLPGDPLAMASIPDRDGNGAALAVVIAKEGKRRLLEWRSGETEPTEIELPPMKSDPERLVPADLDRDGVVDLVLWAPYEGLVFLRRDRDGRLEPIDVGDQGRKAGRAAFGAGRPAGEETPVLLWADRNYLRAVGLRRVGDEWELEILEQVNAPSGAARISMGTLADLDGEGGPEAVLYDRTSRSLLLIAPTGEAEWTERAAIPLGGTTPEWLSAVDLQGDGRPDLVAAGANRIVVLSGGRPSAEWKEVSSYLSPIKDPKLWDMDTGDVNGDGVPDVALCEAARNYVEIVALEPDGTLKPGTRFQVFEEKRFRRARGENAYEPREIAIGDVSADGLDDIVIVVHDRVIVYPQQPAP